MQLTVILNLKMTQINDDFMDSDTGYQSIQQDLDQLGRMTQECHMEFNS